MPTIAELFTPQNVLSYMATRPVAPMVGEALFPSRKIDGLEFDILKAGNRIPTIASVHAFDTEAEIASRQASRSAAEVALIKRKIQIKERDLIALRNPRTAQEQSYLESMVYNDAEQMRASVLARVEKMRMEVLTTGKVTIKENGVDLTLDYGTPASNKISIDATSATVIAEFTEALELLDETPERILTSTKVRNALLSNPQIAGLFKDAGLLAAPGSLNNLFASLGLPQIATYDAKYEEENAKGQRVKKRYFPEDVLVILSGRPQGETIFGSTPRESRLIASTAVNQQLIQNVYSEVYEQSIDPVGAFTIAEATALPSFSEADNVVQVKVTF